MKINIKNSLWNKVVYFLFKRLLKSMIPYVDVKTEGETLSIARHDINSVTGAFVTIDTDIGINTALFTTAEHQNNQYFYRSRISSAKGIGAKLSACWDYFVWIFFGNDLDGYIGDKNWNPAQTDTWLIRLKWWFRNPMHNLMWFTLGIADKTHFRLVFNPNENNVGWNYAVSFVPSDENHLELSMNIYPYVFYAGKHLRFYAGWRSSGAFGFKLNYKKNPA